jgi:Mg2+/Co2+ transporter CorB
MNTFDDVKGDSESLAGLILEVAGEFPAAEWVIPCGDFEFTIMEIDHNRIQLVKVTVNEPKQK